MNTREESGHAMCWVRKFLATLQVKNKFYANFNVHTNRQKNSGRLY